MNKPFFSVIIYVTIIFTFVLQSCSLFNPVRGSIRKYNHPVIVAQEKVILYENTEKGARVKVDSLRLKVGDTLNAFASQYYKTHNYHKVYIKSDTFWVAPPSVLTTDVYDMQKLVISNSVKVKKEDVANAWSRAAVWIAKNSDMTVQVASDVVIATDVPTKNACTGYSATKENTEYGATISLDCKYNYSGCYRSFDYITDMKSGLYFILTGRLINFGDLP